MGIFLLGAPSWSQGAAITATQEKSGFPVERLLTQDPKSRFVIPDPTSITSIVLDAGDVKVLNAISLLASNASSTASWRVRYANTEAALTSSPAYDSTPYGPCLYNSAISWGGIVTDAALGTLTNWSIGCWVKVVGDLTQVNVWTLGTVYTLGWNASKQIEFTDGTITLTSAAITDEDWHHVTCTFNPTGGAAELIVDAVSVDTDTGMASPSGGGFVFANNPNPMQGWINEIAIWDKTLSVAEVAAYYDSTLSPPVANLLGYYNFPEGTGTTTADAAGNLADMSFNGCKWSLAELFDKASDSPDYARERYGIASLVHRPLGASAQWMQIDVIDPFNVDGELRIGRLMVCPADQFDDNMLTGSGPDSEDSSRIEVAETGLDSVTPGKIRRIYQLILSMRNANDAARLVELKESRGSLYDVLFCQDPEATTRGLLWLMQARISKSSIAAFTAYDTQEARFLLQEIV